MLTKTLARGLKLGNEVRTAMHEMLNGAFERFADRVQTVNVVVEDVNGPRGGEDKRVRLELHGTRRKHVMVEGRGTDVLPTLARVLERATYALTKAVDRQKPARLPR